MTLSNCLHGVLLTSPTYPHASQAQIMVFWHVAKYVSAHFQKFYLYFDSGMRSSSFGKIFCSTVSCSIFCDLVTSSSKRNVLFVKKKHPVRSVSTLGLALKLPQRLSRGVRIIPPHEIYSPWTLFQECSWKYGLNILFCKESVAT